MFLGKIVGNVWSTVKWTELEGLRLLMVKPYHLDQLQDSKPLTKTLEDIVIAADVLGACIGEDVLIAYGHAARAGIQELTGDELPSIPIDAAVVAIVDNYRVHAKIVLSEPLE